MATAGGAMGSSFDSVDRGGNRQLGNEGGAAPVGGLTARILRCHAAGGGERCRLVAGEDVALRLGEVRIVVAQIERECLPGKGEADVPGRIARVGDAARKGRDGIEGAGRAELPVADVSRERSADAVHQPGRRSDEGHVARIINAVGAGIEHGRRNPRCCRRN